MYIIYLGTFPGKNVNVNITWIIEQDEYSHPHKLCTKKYTYSYYDLHIVAYFCVEWRLLYPVFLNLYQFYLWLCMFWHIHLISNSAWKAVLYSIYQPWSCTPYSSSVIWKKISSWLLPILLRCFVGCFLTCRACLSYATGPAQYCHVYISHTVHTFPVVCTANWKVGFDNW